MRVWGRVQLLYSRFEASLHYKRPCPNTKQKQPQIHKNDQIKEVVSYNIQNTENSPIYDSPVDAAISRRLSVSPRLTLSP